MTQYRLSIDGEEWTVGSKAAAYDATHCVAGALLAGAEEIRIEVLDAPSFLHTDDDVRERIKELRESLDGDEP